MLFVSPNSSSYNRLKEPYFLVTDRYYYQILTSAAEGVAHETSSPLPQLLVMNTYQHTLTPSNCTLLVLMHKDENAVLHRCATPVACNFLEGESSVLSQYSAVRRKNILPWEIVLTPLTLAVYSLSTFQSACHLK